MRISDWSSDVCSSDLVAGQLVGRHPGQGLAFVAARCAAPAGHAAHVQAQAFVRVLLGDGDQRRADFHFDAEFFAQFADQGVLGGFAGFALAAGEFPEAGAVAAGGAAGEMGAAPGSGGGGGRSAEESRAWTVGGVKCLYWW